MKRTLLIVIWSLILLLVFPLAGLAADTDDPGFPKDMGDDFSRYDNQLIGVSAGTVQELYLKNKVPGAKPAYYNTMSEMAVALKSNKIDGFIAPYLAVFQMIKEDPELTYDPALFGEDEIGFIFSKDKKAATLRKQLNEYIEKIKADGTMEQIIDLFFSKETYTKPVDFSDLTGENGTLRYGTDNEAMPICYMGDGGLTGIDLLLLHGFFEEYGYRCIIEPSAFSSVLAGVSSGVYDFGGGGVVYTAERAETLDFSDIYMTSPQVMVLLKQSQRTGFSETITTGFRRSFLDESRWKLIVKGIATTLLITFSSFTAGIILAAGVCMMLMAKSRLPRAIANALIKIMQGTPVVVILMILYYVVFSQLRVSGIPAAIIGFSILIAAECGELYFHSIRAVDHGQMEAGISVGLTAKECYRYIIIPQTISSVLPGYKNLFISLLKGTAIVGYIAVEDLTRMTDIIRGRTYDAFFPLITTAIIYFLFSWLVAVFFQRLGEKIDLKSRKREIKGVRHNA